MSGARPCSEDRATPTFKFRSDQMTVNMAAGTGVVTLVMDGVSSGRLVEIEPGVLGGATDRTVMRMTISAPVRRP